MGEQGVRLRDCQGTRRIGGIETLVFSDPLIAVMPSDQCSFSLVPNANWPRLISVTAF
jgi:hypothetical protein